MFFNLPQSGMYNLKAKLLRRCNFGRNNFFYFRVKRDIINYKNLFLYSSLNIDNYKYLPILRNKKKCLNLSQSPSFVSAYKNKPVATTKEYVLNKSNEFEEVKTETSQQENKKINEVEKTVSIISENKKNENKRKEDANDIEQSEEKLQRLLNKRKNKRNILTITEGAVKEIKKIIENHNKENKNSENVLKLFFITKGCNGLTYSLKFVTKNKILKNDEIIYDDEKKILLVIDSSCVLFVINTKLDFYRDELTERFVFMNPNIASVCPCGTSFHFSKNANNME